METISPPLACPLRIDAPMQCWSVDLRSPPPVAALACLSAQEITRAARFRLDRQRARYVAGHVALRMVVAAQCGIAAADQRYAVGACGKPCLAGSRDWHFSLSYSTDTAIIALSRNGAIGIDIEAERALDDADDLAASHFDPVERAQYSDVPPDRRNAAFLHGWTRKEACLKALGTGLSRHPSSIATGLGGQLRTRVDTIVVDIGSFELPGLIGAWARLA